MEPEVRRALDFAPNVIIGMPSTELAMVDYLMKHYPVKCINKPLSRKKLLQAMLDLTPVELESPGLIITDPHIEKLPLKVMAVDDNPANLKLITALLAERVDSVVSCTNGQNAVEEALKQKFDIILMDIQMPHMDGVTACQEIKRHSLNTDTPIIAVTAHAMLGERERLLKEGMDDYLTKPIEEHVLQQLLVQWNPHSTNIQPEPLNPISADIPVPLQNSQSQPLAVIDWGMALKQAANKQDLAEDMLKMLVDSIPELIQLSEDAINQQVDQDTLLHQIHKLHGSCSYCGVPRLKNICAVIELALRSGSPIADLEPEWFELQDELEKVLRSAEEYLTNEKDNE